MEPYVLSSSVPSSVPDLKEIQPLLCKGGDECDLIKLCGLWRAGSEYRVGSSMCMISAIPAMDQGRALRG